jgi:hypothetical protein
MNPRLAHLLVRLYPRPWRERYGAEFETLLQTGPGDLRTSANVLWSALREHILPTRESTTNLPALSFGDITRKPSALLPLGMSLTALAVVGSHIAVDLIQNGHVLREADEGTTAHLWQILMAAQAPVLAVFAIKFLPIAPRQTLKVLAVQAGAVLANVAVVFFAGLG